MQVDIQYTIVTCNAGEYTVYKTTVLLMHNRWICSILYYSLTNAQPD